MTDEEYYGSTILKYWLDSSVDTHIEANAINPLCIHIRNWANYYGFPLCKVEISGSRAKGTAITLSSDLDLFISISSSYTGTLSGLYNSLFKHMVDQGFTCRRQNVSIRVDINGYTVDLVPAKRISANGNDHSLYRRKSDSWTKTNVDRHISYVKNSGRLEEIVGLKIWREEKKLEFPSILLETYTIERLSGKSKTNHASNFLFMLNQIAENIQTVRVVDISNSNNILSDELTSSEKKALAAAAKESMQEQYWRNIIN